MEIDEAARSAVEQAVAADDLGALIRGDYPYSVPMEYMAPSTVPTNWSALIRYGFEPVVSGNPAVAKRLEDALVSLVNDAEGVYCSLEFLSDYLSIQGIRKIFGMDVKRISDAIRTGIAAREPQLRAFRPSWLHPTEDIWERVVRRTDSIKRNHGISLR